MGNFKKTFITGTVICVFNLSITICAATELNLPSISELSRQLSCEMTRPILALMQEYSSERKAKPDIILLEAQTLRSLGRFEEAFERYSEFLRLEPSSLIANFEQADCLIELHRNEEVQTIMNVIAAKWPNSMEVLLLKYKTLNRPSEAEEKINIERTIKKFQPASTSDYLRKARWLKSIGNKDEAVELYRTVQKLSPREIVAYIEEATMLAEQKRTKASMKVIEQVLTIDNTCGAAYLIKGKNYHTIGNLIEALVNYDKSESLGVESGILFSERGDLYSKQMMFKEAISDYNAAIIRLPKDYRLYWMRAIAYSERQEQRKAYDDICISTDLAQDKCVDCHYIKGRIAVNLNLRKDAIASFEKFLQLSPDNDPRRALVVAALARLSY